MVNITDIIRVKIVSEGWNKMKKDLRDVKDEFKGFKTVGEMASAEIKEMEVNLKSYNRELMRAKNVNVIATRTVDRTARIVRKLTRELKKGVISQEEFNRRAYKVTNIQSRMRAKINESSNAITRYNSIIGRTNKSIKSLGTSTADSTRKIDRFHAEFLSLMFFGMALGAAMQGLLNPAMQAYGMMEIWSAALTVFFGPIMELLLPSIMSLADIMMDSPEWFQIFAGGIAVALLVIGKLIMSFGMLGLAWFGFKQLGMGMPATMAAMKNPLKGIGLVATGTGGAIKKLTTKMGSLVLKLVKVITKSKLLTTALKTLGKIKLFDALGKTLGKITKSTMFSGTVGKIGKKGAVGLLGIGRLLPGIGLLILGIGLLKTAWDENLFDIQGKVGKFKKWFDEIDWKESWKRIKTEATKVLSTITKVFDMMFEKITSWYNRQDWDKHWEKLFSVSAKVTGYIRTFVGNIFSGMKRIVGTTDWSSVFDNVFKVTESIFKKIARFAGIVIGFLVRSLVSIIKAIPDIFDMLWDIVSGAGSGHKTFLSSVGGFSGIARNIGGEFTTGLKQGYTGMATGGIVTGPTTALIGEAGPEAVIPLDKMGGMGNTININNSTVRNDSDIRAIAEQVNRVLENDRRRFR